jgi:hypothetical protein
MKLITMDQIMPGLQVEVKRQERRKYEESGVWGKLIDA